MAPVIPQNPTVAHVQAFLPKLIDPDADLRYMALSDLCATLNAGAPTFIVNDFPTGTKVVDCLLKTLDDSHGEVQNQAIKCLGALTPKLHPDNLVPLIDKITNLKPSNAVDTSVPAAALRTIITSFSRPVNNVPPSKLTQEGYAAISKTLIPRLIGYDVNSLDRKNQSVSLSGVITARKLNSDAVDVLVEVIRYFGPMLQDVEKQALQQAYLDVFDDERLNGIIKKKALVAMSALAFHLSDRSLMALVSAATERFENPHLTPSLRRILITMVGSLAKAVPHKLGPYVKTLAPHVLSALSKEEYEQSIENFAEAEDSNAQFQEVREAALVALEVLLSSCSHDMRIYTEECIAAGTRYVSYDPTHASSDNDEEMEENPDEDNDDMQLNGLDEGSDDFEEEEGLMSDDDDVSWKVRRCAAKVLTTIISTRSHGDLLENGTLYGKIAPALIKRLEEREENVRLEVLGALALLIKKTSDGRSYPSTNIDREAEVAAIYASSSRKRRRAGSDADSFGSQGTLSTLASTNSPANMSPPAASSPRADLARWTPTIVLGMAKLLHENSISTKQAAIAVLRNMIYAGGGLSEQLGKIIDPIVHAFTAPNTYTGLSSTFTSGGGSTTATKLRIEALQLIGIICDTHMPKIISPHIGHIIANVNASMRDQQYRVSSEAVRVTESIIKALTPPRSVDSEQNLGHLGELYRAIFQQILAVELDLEVRQRAVHALGVLLAHTSGTKLSGSLSKDQRLYALSLILDRLKNETTRLSAIRAIALITFSAREGDELDRAWVNDVAMELGRQLRKADRILRATSLGALKNMALNPVVMAYFDGATIRQLASALLSLLSPNDLNLLSFALAILAKFVDQNPNAVVDKDLDAAICALVVAPLSGAVIESLLGLVKAIGEQGVGRPIMERFLQEVGVTGDPTIVGKSIGTLLVSGGASVRVKLDDFARELQTSEDEQRKCLCLSVLGEAGLRLGTSSPLQPGLFTAHFRAKSSQVALAAAVALGRAGAGNINLYLPVILSTSDVTGFSQYLSLHSIKELLQYVGKPRTDISPYTRQIWEKLLAASQGEDNKAVGAECIGRITVIEPKTFLPLLQNYLHDPTPTIRGMVIQALRFTLADSDETFDEILRPSLVRMLTTMLNDLNLENRRLALGALNSATHNQRDILLPHLAELLPLVMKESKVKPELVRDVAMGPFKHKVDDGLEVRKSAYETLYSLMDIAYSMMNPSELTERLIVGLEDEHEIKVLCNLMLTKLIVLDPEEAVRRLDPIAERFRNLLAFKPKDNAVKQEVEKVTEATKGVLKVTVHLHNAFPAASDSGTGPQGQAWKAYWDWVGKEFRTQLLAMQLEVKSQAI